MAAAVNDVGAPALRRGATLGGRAGFGRATAAKGTTRRTLRDAGTVAISPQFASALQRNTPRRPGISSADLAQHRAGPWLR